MSRLTKKANKSKVFLGKIYEHYIDSFDVDIIYGYENETAKDCGNKFYYGEVIEKLAEYEDINLTPEEIEEMRADAHSLHNENKELKQRLENIEPKFKHKEWCWTIQNGKVWNVNVHLETNVEHIYIFVYDGKKVIDEDGFEEFDAEIGIEWGDKNLFKTKAEAQARLKELEGE